MARVPPPPADAPTERETEVDRWLVEHLRDGSVRVTIGRPSGAIVQHGGASASVRARVAIDAEPRDRTDIDEAVTRPAPVAEGGR